jgi:ATP-dependent helicase HrpB
MTTLATVRVSPASAEQRRGRAGRLAPGHCIRLWSQAEEQTFPARLRPEILEADLTPLALDLAAAGIRDPAELSWVDPPPGGAFEEARSLLRQLGALDRAGVLTAHGQAMSRRSMHPRLAHMVLLSKELGAGDEACDLAALLLERDVLRTDMGVPEADIRTRVDVLRGMTVRAGVNQDALRRAQRESRACRDMERRRGPDRKQELISPGALVALAYPDRIAQRRAGSTGRYLLRNGTGASLEPGALSDEDYLAVADLEGRSREARIRLAAPLSLAEIEHHFGAEIEPEEVISWDASSGAVAARYRERLGALVLREGPASEPDPERVTATLLQGIRESGLHVLPWTGAAQSIRERVAFMRRLETGWPDLSDATLTEELEGWLGPRVAGMRRLEQLARVNLADALRRRIAPSRLADLEAFAPTHVTVPSGSRVAIDYGDPDTPVLAVRLQEVFGWTETPRVGRGRVPLTLHLLSPAGRPVQVTRDLAGFWRTTYFEVRKDLKGRYPRHYWPDDPLTAEPTRRARPQGNPSRE